MRPVVSPSGELLDVRVIPRARRDEIGGERAGRLLIRTTAAPEADKANTAICKQIAKHLGVPAKSVTIVSGHHSRDKTVRITPSHRRS